MITFIPTISQVNMHTPGPIKATNTQDKQTARPKQKLPNNLKPTIFDLVALLLLPTIFLSNTKFPTIKKILLPIDALTGLLVVGEMFSPKIRQLGQGDKVAKLIGIQDFFEKSPTKPLGNA